MHQFTLHRASRVEKAIVEALKTHEPVLSTKVSVFAPDVAAVIQQRQAEFEDSAGIVGKLLLARADLRAAVGRANAKAGISDLLALQARIEAEIAFYQRMPGVMPEPKQEPEDVYGLSRRRKRQPAPPVLDFDTAVGLAAATKSRYAEATASVETEIEVGTVTSEMSKQFKDRLVLARRELEDVADLLRPLNADTTIAVESSSLDWLFEQGVL